jgi:uncharacterized protein
MAKNNRKPGFGKFFQTLNLNRQVMSVGLLVFSLGIVGWAGSELWGRNRTHRLILAAGSKTGESYILAKAIEKVIEHKVPRVQIEVQETKGTTENLAKLETQQASLATAQADVPAGDNARTMAILYSDSFQLVVQGESSFQKFTDLKGKRIGLPQKGGQYDSFKQIAEHFGLAEKDFMFVGDDDQSVDVAFQQKKVDAIFRVRAIGNAQVADLIKTHNGRLIPIDQAEAMRFRHPAFDLTKIPKGAYKGSEPAVPSEELSTIYVQRLLVADARLDPDLVKELTQVINENRREIQALIPKEVSNAAPLVSSLRRPETTGGTGIPVHSGALSYYDRDEPNFFQKNAEYLGLLLTLCLLAGSWIWELKNWMERRQKDLADTYIEQVIEVMNACQNKTLTPQEALAKIDDLFQQVAVELVDEGISQESFRTFNEAYKTVREVIECRTKILVQP